MGFVKGGICRKKLVVDKLDSFWECKAFERSACWD